MLIEGNTGFTVRLRPVRWQFPPDAGARDDRWLVIDSTVDLGDLLAAAAAWSQELDALPSRTFASTD
ncbi:hypothetical protein [Actinoplanes sp. L3-i22]|uniref:hypothetical protein n=1 Tax=Actinoplanes sp. L3-i22 TaxID=2836373 RepID=UPI001C75ECFB|nr:hypothetical protein [Actinoplanes sp. L3-i22]BCY10345.1 hypothetical protein L3i22_054330 [Actinoplanes sp. L3-i22]